MKKSIVYVFLFLLIFFVFLGINFLNNYFGERVSIYMSNRGTVYTQNYIKNAINESVVNELDIDSMYLITKDSNEKITSVLINTAQVNKILSLTNNSMENSIMKLSEEKLELPLSIILGENLFNKMGPNISLRILPVGKYECDIISSVSEYGINNSLFEIYINVSVLIETIVPLQKVESKVNCKIPLVVQIIQGEVPRYYYNTSELVPDVYDNNL